jgi:hypothetical protein
MNRPRLLTLRGTGLRKKTAACAVAASLLLTAPAALAQGQSQRKPETFSVLPISITSVALENGQLIAHGLIGTSSFQTPLAIGAQQTDAACPILDLQLGPIDLNLLGLRILTSPICLAVTAFEGGGLLGDLLCAVSNLLAGGVSVSTALGQLSPTDAARFLNGLTSVLNEVLRTMVANNVPIAATCSILSLTLGPLDLELLGLLVELDNCSNGPVTVDITAIPGGGLLGDLLCSLANLLNNNSSLNARQTLLWQVTRILGRLLA